MNNKYYNLTTGIALALISLMVVASFLLLHVSNHNGIVFLLVSILFAAFALAVFFLMQRIHQSTPKGSIAKNTVKERIDHDDIVVSDTENTVADQRSNVPEAVQTESQSSPVPEESQADSVENEPKVIIQAPDDYPLLKELGNMLVQLESHFVSPLEQDLSNTSNLTKEQIAEYCERLFDISFLAMNIANISTRNNCSYEDATKSLLTGNTDKAEVLSGLDSTLRPTKAFRNLSSVVDEVLPGTSYFYSGYKI